LGDFFQYSGHPEMEQIKRFVASAQERNIGCQLVNEKREEWIILTGKREGPGTNPIKLFTGVICEFL
jgi:hypothetical protein